jgi:PKD repeat protein
MTGTGTYQCDGTCSVTTPPNSACPPPSCSANPASINAGDPTTATGAAGIPPYAWTSIGGLPPDGAGGSYATTYDSTGNKTITITDSNGKSGTCNVAVGASYTATGTVTTAQNQPGVIAYSTGYTIRVKVWDADDRESAWSAPFAYATKPGPWPRADFTFSPDQPFAGLPVQFTDTSANSPTSWLWDFGDGFGDVSQNPAHAFSVEGSYSVTLQATNAAGSCSVTKVIDANKPLPQYREVPPGGQPTPTPRPSERPENRTRQ